MREIKFRGIRVDNGEWAYGYYWQRADGKHYIHSIDRSVDYEDIQVIPETVCQSIGIKDKTGKEIFESDIAKTDDGYIWQIAWSKLTASFYAFSLEKDLRPDMTTLDGKSLEVIGNKFQGKEKA